MGNTLKWLLVFCHWRLVEGRMASCSSPSSFSSFSRSSSSPSSLPPLPPPLTPQMMSYHPPLLKTVSRPSASPSPSSLPPSPSPLSIWAPSLLAALPLSPQTPEHNGGGGGGEIEAVVADLVVGAGEVGESWRQNTKQLYLDKPGVQYVLLWLPGGVLGTPALPLYQVLGQTGTVLCTIPGTGTDMYSVMYNTRYWDRQVQCYV